VVEKEVVQTVAKAIVAVSSVVAIGEGLGMLLPQIPTLTNFFLMLFRALGLLAEFLGIKKRTKKWGIVYDAETKRPLDPAYVTIFDALGNEMESKVTDMDGRFGFLVSPGTYRIAANKTNYAFPSIKISGTEDDLYENIYKGELVNVTNSDIIKFNIPMDPVGIDWNEQIKKKIMGFNPRLEIWKKRTLSIFFWSGLFISPVIYWAVPSKLNLGILIFYVFLAGLRTIGFKAKEFGRIYDRNNGKPLPFAKIKVLLRLPGLPEQRLLTSVTDITGKYYILVVGVGEYVLNITGTGMDGREINTEVPVNAKDRVINFDISV